MSKGTKFTPGPWMADKCDGGKSRVILANAPDGNAFNLAFLRQEYAEAEANARLIAASPELLAACRAMLAELEQIANSSDLEPGESDGLDEYRAAIAKATGGQS